MERVREVEEATPDREVQQNKTEPSRESVRRPGAMVVQTKLVVGAADDDAEREADSIADATMRTFATGETIQSDVLQPRIRGRVARRLDATPTPTDGGVSRVQRSARPSPSIGREGGAVDADTESAITAARGGGRPLDSRIRGGMERSMQADFSGVRVHVGAESDQLNRQLQSKAFTTGSDIFVRSSDYSPGSESGQHLLAHELAHTVQQGASPSSPGGVDRKIDDTINRAIDTRLSAHDYAHAIRSGSVLVQREPDPLAPSVPQSGQSAKFKHYLGQGAKSIAVAEGWKKHAQGDPNAFADIPGDFFSLRRGMSAADAAKYKMAVKELQRKLISSLGGRLKAGIMKRDGIFGKSTEGAVKKFQTAKGLPVTGICDLDTWAAIDNDASAVSSRGREEFQWNEDHEEAALNADGSSGQFGMASAIDWAKKDDELLVNVAYQFDRGPGVDGGSVDVARNAILDIWNTFDIKYKGPKDPKGKKRKPKNPVIKLRFNPVDAATPPPGGIAIKADQRVFLFKSPHPAWDKRGFADDQQKKTRSDAGNWNVDDQGALRNIAAHEFGHAIGLEDEYGRRHKDMTRIAGKVAAYDNPDTVNMVTWFKDKIAASTTFAHLKAIGDKTHKIDAENQYVIAQKYRDTHGSKLPDDLLAAMTRIKTTYATAATQAATDRGAKIPLYQAAFQAAENADKAATDAAKDAFDADVSYRLRPTVGPIDAALSAVRNLTAAAKAAADLARPQHDTALAIGQEVNADRKTAEDRRARATKAAKASKRAVTKATEAATGAGGGIPALEAATIGAVRISGESKAKTRSSYESAKDDATDKQKTADAAREARDAANMAKEIAVAIASRRAQAWGEIGVPSQTKIDAAKAADDAAKLAEAEYQQAKNAASAAKKAARKARELAKSTSKTAPIGIAAGAASVAQATAEQSRAAAWDSSTQMLGQYIARDLAWRRNADSAVFSEWGPWTGSDAWKSAHLQGLSTGGLMGREHGKDVASSPPIDHTHPLEARHVRRYADFVMKYKPDDVWEPVHR